MFLSQVPSIFSFCPSPSLGSSSHSCLSSPLLPYLVLAALSLSLHLPTISSLRPVHRRILVSSHIHGRNKITLRMISPFCLRASWAGPLREQRGPGEKLSHAKFHSRHGQLINGVGSTCLHTPSVHSLSPDNAIERERKRNSVKMQPRKVKIKSLMGPLFQKKVWGPRGSIPCSSPSRWACSRE